MISESCLTPSAAVLGFTLLGALSESCLEIQTKIASANWCFGTGLHGQSVAGLPPAALSVLRPGRKQPFQLPRGQGLSGDKCLWLS